ncbi:uncharacterized protein EI97DRAFT_456616 [Westerdykella ornata]|uniref:Uncharacterized protein n=1 Tax=Westerdykella ornata TaxID=318751 RepID=A0A6A6JQK1_WESOR|nr:uncharacterized protein EI97DRAFT_456616 [Westerdykella ornata]KAF2278178.1 hypothetical protein EI97DRAFT_456616 [Westerdykella ornata]
MASPDDDNEFDRHALTLSKFGSVPPMGWLKDLPPAFEAAPPRKLSSLEKLPREVRQQVYSYLGVPVGHNMWVNCRNESCDEWEPPSWANAYLYLPCGLNYFERCQYQHRWRMVEIQSKSPCGRADQFRFESKTGQGVDSAWLPEPFMDLTLLHVCKSIRDEVPDLLFRDVNVGRGSIARRPGYKRHITRMLKKQANSLRFVAKYCPALVTLRTDFIPACPHIYWDWVFRCTCGQKPKQSTIGVLIAAYIEVVSKCANLQEIVVERLQVRRFEDCPLKVAVLRVLELRDVPAGLKEEIALKWIQPLMNDMVTHPVEELWVDDASES